MTAMHYITSNMDAAKAMGELVEAVNENYHHTDHIANEVETIAMLKELIETKNPKNIALVGGILCLLDRLSEKTMKANEDSAELIYEA